MRHATLIYNPIAGRQPARRGREIRQAAALLAAAAIDVTLAETRAPGEAQDLARAASADPGRLVLACGGDGTINEVLNGLVPGDATLGILPGGTANILARELALPLDLGRAARELPRWVPRRIPVGRATWTAPGASGADGAASQPRLEHRYFLSVGGVGFDAYIVARLSHGFKMSLGVVAYGFEALRQALRYRFPTIVCRTPEGEHRATFAVVQRTRRYAGWFHLAPAAQFFQPQLNLCLFKSAKWGRYLIYASALILRRHLRLSDVEAVQTQRVESFPADPRQLVFFELDGELAGTLPASFEVVPDALTLLVPPGLGVFGHAPQ